MSFLSCTDSIDLMLGFLPGTAERTKISAMCTAAGAG